MRRGLQLGKTEIHGEMKIVANCYGVDPPDEGDYKKTIRVEACETPYGAINRMVLEFHDKATPLRMEQFSYPRDVVKFIAGIKNLDSLWVFFITGAGTSDVRKIPLTKDDKQSIIVSVISTDASNDKRPNLKMAMEYIKERTSLSDEIEEKMRVMEQEEMRRKLEDAKKTGEKQLLKKYTTRCNDPKKECNIDFVKLYATPSGDIETERTHTY